MSLQAIYQMWLSVSIYLTSIDEFWQVFIKSLKTWVLKNRLQREVNNYVVWDFCNPGAWVRQGSSFCQNLDNFGIFQDVKFFFSVVLDVYATVAFGNKERIFGTWFGWTVNLFRSGTWKYEKFLQNLKILHNPIMCCFQRCLFYIWKLWILLKDFI